MNLKIFARKNGGQFAPVLGDQFNRFIHLSFSIGYNVRRLKEVATFETSLVLTDNVNVKK